MSSGRSTDSLDSLVDALAQADGPADEAGVWPEDLWKLVAASGATLFISFAR